MPTIREAFSRSHLMSQTLHGAFGGMFIWLASRVDGEFRRMGVVSALAIAYTPHFVVGNSEKPF